MLENMRCIFNDMRNSVVVKKRNPDNKGFEVKTNKKNHSYVYINWKNAQLEQNASSGF